MRRKLCLILSIAAVVLIFSISAICSLGSQDLQEEEDIAVAEADEDQEDEESNKETVQDNEEDIDPGSSGEDDDKDSGDDNSSDAGGDSNQNNDNKDGNNDSSENDEKPTITLKIFEGPVYSKADEVCYYRIEAITTGTPKPNIKFSKDDSNGAWGNNKVQINLKRDESYTLTATASNSAGKATDSVKLDWQYIDTNHEPVINSIDLGSNDFIPNQQYTFTCDVNDPDNDTIFYDWRAEAGSFNKTEAATVIWTAPGTEGIYDITLDVIDGWGGSDSMTKTVSVGAVPQNAPPVIQEIAVYPEGSKYTNNTYQIWCYTSDPNNSITGFDFNVTGGILYDQSANLIYWDSPGAPGTYTVTVNVYDKEGNTVTGSQDIFVEQNRIEITDIIVQIDYIATSSSYYIKGIIVDPDMQINQYLWSASGGDISDQVGHTAVWNTPHTPGTYSLTLTVNTFGGDSVTLSKDFVVNPPQ